MWARCSCPWALSLAFVQGWGSGSNSRLAGDGHDEEDVVASRRAWLQQPGNPLQQIKGVKGERSLQFYLLLVWKQLSFSALRHLSPPTALPVQSMPVSGLYHQPFPFSEQLGSFSTKEGESPCPLSWPLQHCQDHLSMFHGRRKPNQPSTKFLYLKT